ncbi:hypothetical protein [Aeromicrobium wangtongii]|uniref:Lipoprotein LprG n=1 Tax=Aeromicrobium wangtongii TaxID=2969247 RepID=A0ABY5M7V0_9ACTN|nr:hypothetical protein [Aeromicrobium wangtongii]MCD9198754.1 hypothetical protein [Aeromicrobium wangtongii]UUP13201.1 hypothetical protein NQV15_15275 [Aeromicrobium wangtongii]
MHPRRKQLAIAASTAVLVLGVAACGADAPGTERFSGSSAAGDASAGMQQAAFFRTVADAQDDARTSHVSMKIEANGQSITAEGDVSLGETAADTSMAMTADLGMLGLGSTSMVLADRVLFVNPGAMSDGKYIRIALDDTSNPIARRLAAITDQIDPSQQLKQLEDSVRSMRPSGAPVTIDGVQAQPYELKLDTGTIPGLAEKAPGAGLPKSITYTVYIGSDDLLRRVTSTVAGTSITADFSRWGSAVDIQPPPDDQVTADPLAGLGRS